MNFASAPYNFVPPPERERVVPAVSSPHELPPHDAYYQRYADEKRYTGYFDVLLETETPLYIRGPVPLEQFEQLDRGEAEVEDFRTLIRNRPDFYYTDRDGRPALPGSTLRGMILPLLEIISYSKLKRVSDQRLYYRSPRWRFYSGQMGGKIDELPDEEEPSLHRNVIKSKVKGGFIVVGADGDWEIEDALVVRMPLEEVAGALGLSGPEALYQAPGDAEVEESRDESAGREANRIPHPAYQYATLHVVVDCKERDVYRRAKGRRPPMYLRMRFAHPAPTGGVPAMLVLSGPMEDKHWAHLFIRHEHAEAEALDHTARAARIPVETLDLFHSREQLTPFQKNAFTEAVTRTDVVAQGEEAEARKPGHVRPGEPVFYLTDASGRVSFFGRAALFRLPYENTPYDVAKARGLTDPGVIDYAEAIFGYVRDGREASQIGDPPQGSRARAYMGRVRFLPGRYVGLYGSADPFHATLVPHILSEPKPTAVRHYVRQPDAQRQGSDPTHYDSRGAELRGWKQYWRQGRIGVEDIDAEQDGPVPGGSKQHTQMRPVREGSCFVLRVPFTNLNEREVGALCWAFQILAPHPRSRERQEGYRHQVGMGKPYGMGVVRLEAQLYLEDRVHRYRTLFETDNDGHVSWGARQLGPIRLQDEERLRQCASAFERHVIQELRKEGEVVHLYQLERIGKLLKMMEFPGYPAEPRVAVKQGVNPERPLYLGNRGRPNTRYMQVLPDNEYTGRPEPVLPDPSVFKWLTSDPEARDREP